MIEWLALQPLTREASVQRQRTRLRAEVEHAEAEHAQGDAGPAKAIFRTEAGGVGIWRWPEWIWVKIK